jgi:hypothetical protein
MDRKWHRFTPLALLGLFLVLAVPIARAQPVDFEEETHFRCYTISHQTPEPANLVTLDDQFLPPTMLSVDEPELFCPPTSKNGLEIEEPEEHLTTYNAPSPLEPDLSVRTEDQFGLRTLRVIAARELYVPTRRSPRPGGSGSRSGGAPDLLRDLRAAADGGDDVRRLQPVRDRHVHGHVLPAAVRAVGEARVRAGGIGTGAARRHEKNWTGRPCRPVTFGGSRRVFRAQVRRLYAPGRARRDGDRFRGRHGRHRASASPSSAIRRETRRQTCRRTLRKPCQRSPSRGSAHWRKTTHSASVISLARRVHHRARAPAARARRGTAGDRHDDRGAPAYRAPARGGVPLAGFVTEELRERSRRVGFAVETFDGARGVHMGYRHESLRCCSHYP